MADGDDHAASSQTSAPSIPQFVIEELHERLDGVLGRGVTGVVYSLEGYPNLAVKEILLDGLGKSNVDAIRLELATLPDLSHPGILKYHQVVEDEGFIYIVMNRHDKTLEQVFIDCKRRKTPVSPELVLSILRQLAAALAYLHGVSGVGADGRPYKGLVHRDLKLANVLVSADGEHFIIADFGLCKDALRCGSTIAGTAVYMAPEALLRNEASPASDVWSLGVIIYELVTLRRPDFLEGKDPKDVFVDGWRPDLSGVTDGFMQNVLERIFVLEPEERLTAKELHEMLTTSNVPVNELGHRYVALEGKCSALETALNTANARITLLEEDAKAKLDRITALEAALDARSAETASLKDALETKAARIDALEKDARAREDKVAALEKDLGVRSTKIDALEKDINTKADRISALEKDLSAKSARIDAFENQGKEHLAMIKALESKIAQFNNGMNAADPQSDFLLLPRLIRAAHMNCTETVRVLLEEGVRTGQRDKQKMTALMHAAQQGHGGPVELLVEKEKGLRDKNGWTALMHAIHNSHSKVARILVPHEHGKRNNNGRTALVMAVANSCVETVRALVEFEHGLRDSHGHTALMIAAEKGHAEIASLLVPHEKGLTDSRGSTALMIAVASSHAEAARAIAEHEHSSRDPQGRTALMIAAQQGSLEIVRALVEHEKGLKDNTGCTALSYAARAGHRDVTMLLMDYEKDAAGWTMLMCAAALGDIDMASRHLDEKGQRDKRGQTALIIAAQNGRDEVVKLLMKHESGVSGWTGLIYSAYLGDTDGVRENVHEKGCTDITWMTALMRAAQRGHQGAVEFLLEHEKGMKDKDGNTAFMYALKNQHTDIALLLREHEAPSWTLLMCAAFTGDATMARRHLHERDVKNSDDETALMIAAREGYRDIIELLDPTDEDGVTALMRAAARGDTKTTELLIPVQKGMKDRGGDTALMYALRNRHIDTAVVLGKHEDSSWTPLMRAALAGDITTVKKYLSDKDKKNSDGETALTIAARAGHKDVVELLDPTDENGVTALMRAADRNDPVAAMALAPLQAGQRASGYFYIGNQSIYNVTALIIAAAHSYADIVELLLEKEGGMYDTSGRTALMRAAANGHLECVRLLAEKEKNINRSSLLDIAEGNREMMALLSE